MSKMMRRCPGCGFLAELFEYECPRCERDLLNVPFEACDEAAADVMTKPDESLQTPETLVRECPCGAKNPSQTRKCIVCGEDISDVIPTVEADVKPAARSVCLMSLDGECKIAISDSPVTLGREHACAEYLQLRRYVSRKHATLVVVDGRLLITSLADTNPSFVNNLALGHGEERLLHPGDEIGLGGCLIDGERQTDAAYFTVHLEGG